MNKVFCVFVCSGTECLDLFEDELAALLVVSDSFKLVNDNERSRGGSTGLGVTCTVFSSSHLVGRCPDEIRLMVR